MEMRRDELIARARELERVDKLREACDIYAGIAQHDESEAAAALWTRIGYLQLSAENPAAAATSFASAIELFSAAGQRNNALAVSRALLELSPDNNGARATAARLAIEEGYHDSAREFAMRLLDLEPPADELCHSIAIGTAFGIRFPDDAAFWRAWAEGALASAGREQTLTALTQLDEEISASGSTAAARAIKDEIARISPSGSAPEYTSREPAQLEDTGPPDLALDELFISPGPLHSTAPAEDPRSGRDVAPLEGLERTHDGARDSDQGDTIHLEDRLTLLDPAEQAGAGTSTREVEVDDAADDEEPLDALPLLADSPDPELPSFLDPTYDHPDLESEDIEEDADDSEPLPLLERSPVAEGPFDIAAILEELFSITTRGVEPADAATHYDLGLAYKEMDLVEESIAQFASAIEGGFRPIASLEVVGEILAERGDHVTAARILQRVTETDSVPDLERVGVLYWLARCREAMGDAGEAHRLWRRVAAVDSDFRDTSERLRSSARSGF
jgi:tetratricopeptide (TPR) repeat protein